MKQYFFLGPGLLQILNGVCYRSSAKQSKCETIQSVIPVVLFEIQKHSWDDIQTQKDAVGQKALGVERFLRGI